MATDALTLRFFAKFREELGIDSETLPCRENLTAGGLRRELAARGGAWAQLDSDQPVMIAVNQTMARPDTLIHPNDEVAFFPPVTGG